MGAKKPRYHCIHAIVQPCHVSTKHLLAETFSCMCILLSEFCCVLCIDVLLITIMCRLISGDKIMWHSFCACEHHGAQRRFQQALDLDVDKVSVLLTQCKSEFEKWIRADRPAIEIPVRDFLSYANCLCLQGLARMWLLDSRLQMGAAYESRLSVLLWRVRWSYPWHSWC